MVYKYFPLLLIAVFLSAGCTGKSKAIVAKVGDYTISKGDAEYRAELAKLSYPKSFEGKSKQEADQIGLNQLIGSYLNAQILKNNGKIISEKTIKTESDRIEAETRDHETLDRIKSIFGRDKTAYERVFVLPTFADRTIYYGFFLTDPKFQAQSIGEPGGLVRAVNELHLSFDDIVKKNSLKKTRLFVSEKKGIETDIGRKTKKASSAPKLIDLTQQTASSRITREQFERESAVARKEEALFFINEIATATKPGRLFRTPVDRQTFWEVIRYVGPGKPGEYVFDSILFPKLNYEVWFENEKKKVVIERRSI